MNGVPILDPYSLDPTRYWLLGQIEYYFSFENLCRDMFLRSKVCLPPASLPTFFQSPLQTVTLIRSRKLTKSIR